MYIKKVIIKGFKTYRNETVVDNFSPGQNVVIGSNGSGKSNLFAAIRFVLSDDYSNLKREERQGLIHQGAGSVMSTSVEVIFDDSDHKMILTSGVIARPNNEVFVRRTLGLKKDDYQINDRNVTKGDVMRMLESAGFSMSNPYNIVPQGRIISVTNAKDDERLRLLEDVVGAKSFELKLKASLKNMKDTEFKKDQIMKELDELNDKLKDMESERKELEHYNNLERNRKVYQFTLYDRELNNIILQIEQLDDTYHSAINSSEQYVEELDKRETLINDITIKLKDLENQLKLKNNSDLPQLKSKHSDIVNQLTNINLKLDDVNQQIKYQKEQFKTDKINLETIKEEIENRRNRLTKIKPRFDELTKEEKILKLKLDKLKSHQRDLLLKKGNYSRFTSQEERNEWITQEIKDQEETLNNLRSVLKDTNDEKNDLETTLITLEETIEDLNDSIEGPVVSDDLQTVSNEIVELKEKYAENIDKRKELWRAEQRLQTVADTLDDDVKEAQRRVNETMSRDLANGIHSVKEIAEKLKLPEDAVFGTLGELIKVSSKYKTCAEVVGGNSLFHVVVDTDETATVLMRELFNMKGGRVTFMPLNRIYEDPNFSFPPHDQNSVFTPLIKKIKYDIHFEKAVKHVFGKTIVVKDLSSGLQYVKRYKLNAITLDGDRVDRRGVLTGGYIDQHKKTRLDSLKKLTKSRNEHSKTIEELKGIKQSLHELDSSIDLANGDIRTLSSKKETILTDLEQLRNKLNNKKNEHITLKETISLLESKREKTESLIESTEIKIKTYNSDLLSKFDSELSEEEKNDLTNVTSTIANVSNDLHVTNESLESIISTMDQLEAELNSKFLAQQEDIQRKIDDYGDPNIEKLHASLETLSIEKETLVIQEKESNDEIKNIQNEIESLTSEKVNNVKLLEKTNTQQRSLLKKIEDYQKDVEKSMIKKATLIARRDDLQQKIREVGLLAEDILNNCSLLTNEDLLRKLNEVNVEMNGLTNVNKRAFENFKKFHEKQKEMTQRAEELEESKSSIQELIEKLKQQKINAVDNTFKKVSENFVTVFEKLVPRGTGKLIIHRNEDIDMNSPENDIESVYIGVSISVSFNSKNNEQLRVEQLSGGQKTLCAIALILAIQMVEPAPFYLFDEVDAALDKQYRTAVANTIKELSQNAQFICTTFRTDMLQLADRFFRVKYENKISTVVELEREDAVNYIRGSRRMGEI